MGNNIGINYLTQTFPDISLTTHDFELGAELYNRYRVKGVQSSHIDFLICAVAMNHDIPIFTLDKDFENYSAYISFKLFS